MLVTLDFKITRGLLKLESLEYFAYLPKHKYDPRAFQFTRFLTVRDTQKIRSQLPGRNDNENIFKRKYLYEVWRCSDPS